MTDTPKTGAAGRVGDDVRSDLQVRVTRRPGALELSLRSKVAPYYGAAIERQVRELLAARKIADDLLVEIEDKGALPFVIAARLEAALAAAGYPDRFERLEPRGSTPRDRLRRSRLYLPGNEPKFMVNAGLHGPDGVILDLEDSVHPDHKHAARYVVRRALADLDFGRCERMVRINQLPQGLEDLDVVVPAQPDLILIPKVERPEEVRAVDDRIRELHGLATSREVWLMPILESARGIENAYAIAEASERVAALTIGLEDYTADLGVVKTKAGDETLWARSRMLNAARAAGCQAIDSVYGDVGDVEGLRAWAERGRALGFEGMGCIHPRQIPVIHQAFAPGEAEIAKAQRIVSAFEHAKDKGLGVVSLGSKMIDPPVVNRALKLVAQARAMGLIAPAAIDEQGAQEAQDA